MHVGIMCITLYDGRYIFIAIRKELQCNHFTLCYLESDYENFNNLFKDYYVYLNIFENLSCSFFIVIFRKNIKLASIGTLIFLTLIDIYISIHNMRKAWKIVFIAWLIWCCTSYSYRSYVTIKNIVTTSTRKNVDENVNCFYRYVYNIL